MTKLSLGPRLSPADLTLTHLRRALYGYLETEPDAKKRDTLYPVLIPEGASPQALPGFVHIKDFGMPAVAQERIDLVPEGLRLVGQVENFLLVEGESQT